jgi:inosose dehydratase
MSNYKIACHTQMWNDEALPKIIEVSAELDFQGIEAKRFSENDGRLFENVREALKIHSMQWIALGGGGDFVIAENREDILRENMRIAALSQKFGAAFLVIETGRREIVNTIRQDFKVAAETLNELGKRCTNYDLCACIHPHIGHRIETEEDIDRILNLVDTREVFLCLDVGHLAAAGYDPVHIFKTYGSCVRHVHFQDAASLVQKHENQSNFCALGQGIVDFPRILEVMNEQQYDGWITIDYDETPDDPEEFIQSSKQYLNHLLSVQKEQNPELQ